jgi:hypothetical protein
MMEAVRTSETSVKFNMTTRSYIPEKTKLHTRRREDLKSHCLMLFNKLITVYSENHKGKAVPLHAMEALGGRGGIAPTHS